MEAGKVETEKKALNEREEKLLRYIREVQFGEIRIVIQGGEPIRIEELKKSIKL